MSLNKFNNFYWLKEELVSFCYAYGLALRGSKKDLTERIFIFLSSGEKTNRVSKLKENDKTTEYTLDTVLSLPFGYSEKKRAFFKEYIGENFTFNVRFQKWIKANIGLTYRDAVEAYKNIIVEGKTTESIIDPQFEYNTYIRAFFKSNKGRTLKEAIICWKYKKSVSDHNRYEDSDLTALE